MIQQWLEKVTSPSYLCEDNRIHGDGSPQLPVLPLGRQRRRWNRQLLRLLTSCFPPGLDGAAVFLLPEAPQSRDADPRPTVHHLVQLAPVTLETSGCCLSPLCTRPFLSQGQSSPASSWRSGIPRKAGWGGACKSGAAPSGWRGFLRLLPA